MLLDKASSKDKFALKILAVFLICAADMLFAAWVIYAEKQKGTLLSVRAASSYLPQLFAQNLLNPMLFFQTHKQSCHKVLYKER